MNTEKTKEPIGMLLIRLFYSLAVLGYIYATILYYTGNLPVKFTIVQRLIGMILPVLWVLIIVVITKRYVWGWYIIIGVSIFNILHDSIKLLFINKPIELTPRSCLTLLLQLAILIYIGRKRSYFNR